MLEALLEAAKTFGPLFLFMLSPVLVPLIGIGIGIVFDRLRGK